MKRAVMCIVKTQGHAQIIVARLHGAGIPSEEISVLFPDQRVTVDFAAAHDTKAPEGAAAGIGAGGVLGGSLGLLAGIGAIAIPGVGPLIAAGPILATLSGVAAGATVGGLTGALIGLGIPETEAKRFEGSLRGGHILIAVHTESPERRAMAEQIFDTAGAQDISSTRETVDMPTMPARTRT